MYEVYVKTLNELSFVSILDGMTGIIQYDKATVFIKKAD